jgi:hypothetical protein
MRLECKGYVGARRDIEVIKRKFIGSKPLLELLKNSGLIVRF